MNMGLNVGLILAVVCFVGYKRKSEPAKSESKSATPNIAQPTKAMAIL